MRLVRVLNTKNHRNLNNVAWEIKHLANKSFYIDDVDFLRKKLSELESKNFVLCIWISAELQKISWNNTRYLR